MVITPHTTLCNEALIFLPTGAAFMFFIWVTPKAAFKRPLYFQLLQICPVSV